MVMLSRKAMMAQGGTGKSFAQVMQDLLDEGVLPVWYRFNETEGTTIVNHGSLGEALNGTLHPGVGGLGAEGLLGSGDAINLDGADTVIEVPQHAVLNTPTYTQAFLMRMRSAGESDEGYLWSLSTGPLATVQFINSLSVIKAAADTFSVDAVTQTSAGIDANWVWLFRTYDDAGDRKVRLYIGNAEGLSELPVTTQTAATGSLRLAGANAIIGGSTVDPIRACDGWLDEMLLISKVLSEDEMREIVSSCPFSSGLADFYVDDFGAAGDGVTDDAAAINKACAAAKISGGGTIRFTSGKNYAIGKVIEVTGDNIILSGYGAIITMLADTNLGNTLRVYGASGARLQGAQVLGLTIDANYGEAGGYQKRGLRLEHVDGAMVKDVTVQNSFVSLHFDTGAKDSVADGCECLDYYDDGFDAGGTAAVIDDDEPTGITFQNCQASSSRDGIGSAWEIEDGANNITVKDSETDGLIVVRNHVGDNAKTQDILFENVQAGGFSFANTYDTETNYVKNITVRNCTGEITTSGTIEGLVIEP